MQFDEGCIRLRNGRNKTCKATMTTKKRIDTYNGRHFRSTQKFIRKNICFGTRGTFRTRGPVVYGAVGSLKRPVPNGKILKRQLCTRTNVRTGPDGPAGRREVIRYSISAYKITKVLKILSRRDTGRAAARSERARGSSRDDGLVPGESSAHYLLCVLKLMDSGCPRSA